MDADPVADLYFHRTWCQLTGHAMLLHSWRDLEGSIRMFFMWGGIEQAVGNMGVDRHSGIVDVIAAGDEAEAADQLLAHRDEAAGNLIA